MNTTAFSPTASADGTRWFCPCQDAFGQSAMLNPVRNFADKTARMGENIVENYACDQNGDRWQRIVATDGTARWHYLGRRER